MKKRALLRLAPLVAVLSVLSLRVLSGDLPAQPQGGARDGEALHLLFPSRGKVSLKRRGWSTAAPAAFGTVVRRGDLLILDRSAAARVVCADLTVKTVPAGQASGVPCLTAQPVLTLHGRLINTPRGGELTGGFPVVLSPRRTRLLGERPVLRWQGVPGAASYRVDVRGPGLDWSTEVGAATSVPYPPGAPAFTPGTTYQVIVTAGGHSSTKDPDSGAGFSLLTPAEVRPVREAEGGIGRLRLPAAEARFLTARLYAAHALHAEAIEILEELAASAGPPAVLRALGEGYQRTGLPHLAAECYRRAAEQSRLAGDLEGQAAARASLGVLQDEVLGEADGAEAQLRSALELYRQLGDAAMSGEIQQRLAEIAGSGAP